MGAGGGEPLEAAGVEGCKSGGLMPHLLSRRWGELLAQETTENLQRLLTRRSGELKPGWELVRLGFQTCSARGGRGIPVCRMAVLRGFLRDAGSSTRPAA